MARELPAADLLRSAARLIERALIQLDMKERTCECCSARRFDNFAHAKTYEQFSNTPLRLTEAALRLEGKEG